MDAAGEGTNAQPQRESDWGLLADERGHDRDQAVWDRVEPGAAASDSTLPEFDASLAGGGDGPVEGLTPCRRVQTAAPWTWKNPETGEVLDSEALITNNLNLARKAAYRWARKCKLTYDELEAIAFVGLVKGCRRYDPTKGFKLSTIAVPYINGEILHFFRDRGHAIKFPSKWRELLPRAKRMTEAGESRAAIAKELGVEVEELDEMLAASQAVGELREDLEGAPDAHWEDDLLSPVFTLVESLWERLHRADRTSLDAFWGATGRRRPVFPSQALAQFLNLARRSLQGQTLPEIRREILKQLALPVKVLPAKDQEDSVPGKRIYRRRRSTAQLEQVALELGLILVKKGDPVGKPEALAGK